MNRPMFFALLFFTSFVLCHCDDSTNTALSDAANCFTLNLYKAMQKENANVGCSPFSADILLSLLRTVSGGKTEQELTKALGYDQLPVSDMQDGFKTKLDSLKSSQGNTLDLKTSVWMEESFEVNQKFLDVAKKYFKSETREADIAQKASEVTKEINDWVKKETNGIIPKILDKDLDPSVILVLLNVMFFNGTWQSVFDPQMTRKQAFNNKDDSSSSTNVMMMSQTTFFNYKDDGKLNSQVLELKYKGGDMSMVFLLPKTSIDSLERTLTCDNMKDGFGGMKSEKVHTQIPKFKVESSFDLKTPFQALGINEIFQKTAELSGIAPQVYVSKAVQKCVVKVDERGTEAAAATAVEMVAGAAPNMEPPKDFVADHPFLFFILHKPTNLILLMGRVMELPEAAEKTPKTA